MPPDRAHSDTVGRVANQIRVEVRETPFNPYFYVIKNRSSDALPTPEIFLSSRFCLVFLPTTFASLPPGVMFLNRSTAPRNSATDIEKTSQQGTPERVQPNRSVVKKLKYSFQIF